MRMADEEPNIWKLLEWNDRPERPTFRAGKEGNDEWIVTAGGMENITLRRGEEFARVPLGRFRELNRDRIAALLAREADERTREREILRLPEMPRQREVIALTDLHGNMAALGYALARNGLAEETPQGWRPTEKGMQSTLVIGGDANDRGSSFLPIVETLLSLQEQGMDARVLWGDHELGLKALTGEPATLSEDETERSEMQVIQWIHGEAKATLAELEAWYVSTHGPAGTDPTEEERTWLEAKGFADTLYKDAQRRQLVLARRLCTGDGPVARFFASLEAVATQDDLLYLHALPNAYWTQVMGSGSREDSAARTNARFQELLQDPRMVHLMTFGQQSPDAMQHTGTMHHSSVVYPPEAALVWDRFSPHAGLPAEVTGALKDLGWSGMVRGHDTQQRGQKVHQVNGLAVMNIDVVLQSGKMRGYTRVDRDGRVMGWTEKV